jgi:hypothetical protein
MAQWVDGHLMYSFRFWLVIMTAAAVSFMLMTLFFSLVLFPWLFGLPLWTPVIFAW